MSHVTDIILLCDDMGASRFQRLLHSIEEFGVKLVSIEDRNLPQDWYCGPKRIQSCVAIGTANNLDIAGFLENIRKDIQWENTFKSFCQVAIKDENDHGYTLHEIFRSSEE